MREFESRCLKLEGNSSINDIRNVEALWAALKEVGNRQFCEIWLSSSDGGPALCALINGEASWLTYLRNDEGDPGYSTRNPDYTGPEILARERTAVLCATAVAVHGPTPVYVQEPTG